MEILLGGHYKQFHIHSGALPKKNQGLKAQPDFLLYIMEVRWIHVRRLLCPSNESFLTFLSELLSSGLLVGGWEKGNPVAA